MMIMMMMMPMTMMLCLSSVASSTSQVADVTAVRSATLGFPAVINVTVMSTASLTLSVINKLHSVSARYVRHTHATTPTVVSLTLVQCV